MIGGAQPRNRLRTALACLVALVLGALHLTTPSAAAGSDPSWPGFRGPGGVPVSDNGGLPLHWSTTDNVEWKVAVPGLGW